MSQQNELTLLCSLLLNKQKKEKMENMKVIEDQEGHLIIIENIFLIQCFSSYTIKLYFQNRIIHIFDTLDSIFIF